jgi:hypothetical protein
MCRDFGRMIQKLTVAPNFIEPADRTQIGVPVGPQQESSALKFIEELVTELHNCESSLKSVTINVGVPQPNEKPFTIPQANVRFSLLSSPPTLLLGMSSVLVGQK